MPKNPQSKPPMLLSFACPIQWDEMAGDNQTRNCERCSCKVQNIDDFTPADLDALQQKVDAGEEVCVAFSSPAPPPNPRPVNLFQKLPIALAASIGLALVPPSFNLQASAQSPQSSPNTKDPATAIFSNIQTRTGALGDTITTTVRNYTEGKEVPYGTGGFNVGKAACSTTQILVNQLCRPNGIDVRHLHPSPQLKAFCNEATVGTISRSRVEALATEFDRQSNLHQERICYLLLIEQSKTQNVTPEQLNAWQQKALALVQEEFNQQIVLYARALAKKRGTEALQHLLQAHTIRSSDPTLAKTCPWSEMASRFDKIEPFVPLEESFYFAMHARNAAEEEHLAQKPEAFIEDKRLFILETIKKLEARASNDAKRKHYSEAFRQYYLIKDLADFDVHVWRRCDWGSFIKALKSFEKHIDGIELQEFQRLLRNFQELTGDSKATAQ